MLETLAPALYLSGNQNLFVLTGLHNAGISLRWGNAPRSCPGYALYGLILGAALGDYKSGYEFGEMAVRLSQEFDSLDGRCKTIFTFAAYLVGQRRPLRENEALFQESYRLALEAGNTIYAGYAIYSMTAQMALWGMELDELDAQIEKYLPYLRSAGDSDQWLLTSLTRQMGRNLQGRTANKSSLDGEDFDETAVRAAMESGKHGESGQCWYFLVKARGFGFWSDWDKALEMARDCERFLPALLGTPFVPEHNFFYSLSLAATFSQKPDEKKAILGQLAKNQRGLKKWALNCPENFAHKEFLVAAEIARITGRSEAAAPLYDAAIRAARDAGYVQNEALANELAARFYEADGRPKPARVYWEEAHYLYEKWGAHGKVAALEAEFPELRAAPVAAPAGKRRTIHATTDGDTSSLDLATVVKAAQALSGEIDLPRLLQQLLRFALENAGATRGALILRRDDQLLIEAMGEAGAEIALPSQLLEENGDLPLSVIQYVVRTRESVVLGDATREGLFTGDATVVARQIRSILCAPIVHQAKLNGLIYLENSLAPGAFTPERLEVLNVLSAQAAISLQNARLYGQLNDYSRTLKARVEERTEELRAKNEELERTLRELKEMQNRVIVQEKMASLGALTAGIAHEIKNPLNFVNNFAALSVDLTEELGEEIAKIGADLDDETRAYFAEILADLKSNAQKINEHGKRADSIVRGMLLHSRGAASQPEAADLNALVREAVQLAYHGQRALDSSFNVTLEEAYDPKMGEVRVLPHKISRVVLNLANNACYASNQKARRLGGDFSPLLGVKTQVTENSVEIRVCDNGDGIPEAAREKIFTPFFTSKPPGEGTGLGLSMSYDIVVGQHGGELRFESTGEGTEFVISLPKVEKTGI